MLPEDPFPTSVSWEALSSRMTTLMQQWKRLGRKKKGPLVTVGNCGPSAVGIHHTERGDPTEPRRDGRGPPYPDLWFSEGRIAGPFRVNTRYTESHSPPSLGPGFFLSTWSWRAVHAVASYHAPLPLSHLWTNHELSFIPVPFAECWACLQFGGTMNSCCASLWRLFVVSLG